MHRAVFFAFAIALASGSCAQVPPFVSGGVGKEERAALLANRDDFSLQLMFAARGTGNFLADVEVRIEDEQGVELLRSRSEGPYFLVQLSPAAYTVSATYAGETQTRRVRIEGNRPTALALYWDLRE